MATEARDASDAVVVAIEADGTNAYALDMSEGIVVAVIGDGTNAQARICSEAIMVLIELTFTPQGQFFPIQI